MEPKISERLMGFLTKAVHGQATDIYITVGAPPMCRVNGDLEVIQGEENRKLFPADTEELLFDLIDERQRAQLEEKGHIDFSCGIAGVARFRINIFRQRGTYVGTFRVINDIERVMGEESGQKKKEFRNAAEAGKQHFSRGDETGIIKTRLWNSIKESYDIPDEVLSLYNRFQNGLVLVTGPTGSGKTTTLAALIQLIRKTEKKHVITLEDPIEYLYRHDMSIIHQREIGVDVNTFAEGLRAALREDPDVILVGEMRDIETISIALTAAETGHLVFSTLHTTDAVSSINRIIDAYPAGERDQIRLQLAEVLRAVVSQKLILEETESTMNMTAEARTVCRLFEYILCTPAIRNLIRDNCTYMIPNYLDHTMKSFDQALEEAAAGPDPKISLETAKRYVSPYSVLAENTVT